MLPRRTKAVAIPSKNALRILRQLALAGSTLGSVCTVAALTYDVQRRVAIAEQIIENKRTLRTSAPYYNATSAARKLKLMVEAAEAGEFEGLNSLKDGGWRKRSPGLADAKTDGSTPDDSTTDSTSTFNIRRVFTDLTPSDSARLSGISQERTSINADSNSQYRLNKWSLALGHSMHGNRTKEVRDRSKHWEVTTYLRSPNLDCVRRLYKLDRIIEAAELLLEKHMPLDAPLSPETRDLAQYLFYANCHGGNAFIARHIFTRLEEVDAINDRMWEALLVSLAKAGAVESTARLYLKYYKSRELPTYLIEVILRCLLESQRLSHASNLMSKSIRHDHNCGLCGIYLSTLWKKTRNIDLMNQQLEKLLLILPRFKKTPTQKLFNPVLKAYIRFGRFADAEALVADMQNVYNIPLTGRTMGLLLHAHALSCNWAEVEKGFQELHERGYTSGDQYNFTRTFDTIFLEFWPSHNIAEIHQFIVTAVEKYGLIPDQVLYTHILIAYLEKGVPQDIQNFIALGETHQWSVKFNEDEFMKLVQKRRRSLEHSPVGLWQMLNVAKAKNQQAAFSRQVMGYDQRSVPHSMANLIPYKKSHPSWYRRMVRGVRTNERPIDHYLSLHTQMLQALYSGSYNGALRSFNVAKISEFTFKTYHVQLAIIATLAGPGRLKAAQDLVDEHWEVKRRITPKFFSQIRECDLLLPDIEVLKLAVFGLYGLCWEEPSLQLKHHFMINIVRWLISHERHHDALDLMITTYKSRYARYERFDGVCMKLFIRAFTATGNFQGVRWCIMTALSRESACGESFVSEMRRSVAILRMRMRDRFQIQYRKQTFYYDNLDTLVDMVERKMKGDPQMAGFESRATRKRLSKHFQPQLNKWRDIDLHTVKQTIVNWDEELEFEYLLQNMTRASSVSKTESWREVDVVREGDEYSV